MHGRNAFFHWLFGMHLGNPSHSIALRGMRRSDSFVAVGNASGAESRAWCPVKARFWT
jgi:hypothetical protein